MEITQHTKEIDTETNDSDKTLTENTLPVIQSKSKNEPKLMAANKCANKVDRKCLKKPISRNRNFDLRAANKMLENAQERVRLCQQTIEQDDRLLESKNKTLMEYSLKILVLENEVRSLQRAKNDLQIELSSMQMDAEFGFFGNNFDVDVSNRTCNKSTQTDADVGTQTKTTKPLTTKIREIHSESLDNEPMEIAPEAKETDKINILGLFITPTEGVWRLRQRQRCSWFNGVRQNAEKGFILVQTWANVSHSINFGNLIKKYCRNKLSWDARNNVLAVMDGVVLTTEQLIDIIDGFVNESNDMI